MNYAIDIAKADKARVLQALYANAKVQGLGRLHYVPGPLPLPEAQQMVQQNPYFDYLKGRVIKCGLDQTPMRTNGYDMDNGVGAAWEALRHVEGCSRVSMPDA